ncbi:MAG: hypothetical protein LWX56_12450 [Ignavibacteria bacterium]|nr:hypothetical protein [Ignavibacteria bacterium]
MFRFLQKKESYIFIFLALFSLLVFAKNTGKVKRTLKEADTEGCSCHGDNSKSVAVTINGPAMMHPGETANFTVAVSGGPMLNGGFNVAVSDGQLIEGPGSKMMKDELTHVEPLLPKDGKLIFNFKYTAPAKSGNITMFAVGVSGNKDETKKGDLWSFAPNKTITVKAGK